MSKIKHYILNNKIGLAITFVILTIFIVILILLLRINVIVNQVDDLQIRQSPQPTAKSLAKVPKGTKLIVLDNKSAWYKVRRDDKNDDQTVGWVASWVVQSKHLKRSTPLSEATIQLDAGHGGSDSGAIANNGKSFEKTYTLKTVKRVQKLLEQRGARVVLTRDDDHFVSLAQRPEISRKQNVDVFISFHFDSSDEANTASGITQYYYHKQNHSKIIAQYLSKRLNKLPLKNRGVDFGDFQVLRDNQQPAVLLENGYINNDKDFRYIRRVSYQQQIANNVTAALNDYFNHTVETNPR